MRDKFQYRLSKDQKSEIAQNLIDILQKDANITEHTKSFVCNWILTGPDEKRKAFFDIWDIVLKNYLPTERPILFRACKRGMSNNKIASFTGRLECARRIANGRDYLIICDTKEELEFEDEFYNAGEYEHTFYPLVDVLIKAKDSLGNGFSERMQEYIGEDEYIMRINVQNVNKLKWVNYNS
ncbi:MAG: hypothetical protein V4666_02670 [Bacteroidota bacterium]